MYGSEDVFDDDELPDNEMTEEEFEESLERIQEQNFELGGGDGGNLVQGAGDHVNWEEIGEE